jgi:hypothetical protein
LARADVEIELREKQEAPERADVEIELGEGQEASGRSDVEIEFRRNRRLREGQMWRLS